MTPAGAFILGMIVGLVIAGAIFLLPESGR